MGPTVNASGISEPLGIQGAEGSDLDRSYSKTFFSSLFLDLQSTQNNDLYARNKGCMPYCFGRIGGPGKEVVDLVQAFLGLEYVATSTFLENVQRFLWLKTFVPGRRGG